MGLIETKLFREISINTLQQMKIIQGCCGMQTYMRKLIWETKIFKCICFAEVQISENYIIPQNLFL